ncbi:hypothetical protein N7456_007115 [Penicillium angulare]|uniref:Uncharacterized protein n=1 Tax=Penicillium angulare TaxID=116970 RepID=A0A9W9FIW7_9EURO|nr:hypothetical protein N7456_007115 [Penicillium angulare]
MEEELGYYQRFMDDFLEAIRSSDDNEVHHIINAVRMGSSTREIHFASSRSDSKGYRKYARIRAPSKKAGIEELDPGWGGYLDNERVINRTIENTQNFIGLWRKEKEDGQVDKVEGMRPTSSE